jgi:hypothetical protein
VVCWGWCWAEWGPYVKRKSKPENPGRNETKRRARGLRDFDFDIE